MKNLITDKRKIAEGRGTGTGKDYIPFVNARDFNSMGTCSTIRDWKTGRSVETLSQGEANYWHILRFDDRVTDIREQFPLELEDTNRIAERLGVRPIRKGVSHMTTDFLIDFTDGHQEAHSVKPSKRALENNSVVKSLYIESLYWAEKGVDFKLIFSNELDIELANNIRFVSRYYDLKNVNSKIDCLKHLLICKAVKIDMSQRPLDIPRLLLTYEREVNELWQKISR